MDIFGDFAATLLKAGIGVAIGTGATWLYGRWQRRRELQRITEGRWDTTLEFKYVFLEDKEEDGAKVTRFHVRPLGSLPLANFFGDQEAKKQLTKEAWSTHKVESIIPMQGQLGSYILRELHGMLKLQAPKDGYPSDWWVMVPTYETFHGLDVHTPAVLLVRPKDLLRCDSFPTVKDFRVMFGDSGATLLTMLELREKWLKGNREYLELLKAGKPTRHVEQQWMVELRLDLSFTEPTTEQLELGEIRRFKRVSWERYAEDLALLGYQT